MQFIETLSTSAAEDPDPLVHFAVSSSWHVVAVIAPTPTDEDGVTYHALLDQMRGNDRAPSIKVDRDLADLDSLPRYEAAAMMRTDPELLRQATLDQPIRIDEDDTYEVLLLLDDETGEQWSDEVGAAAAEGGYESAEWDARHVLDVDYTEERDGSPRPGHKEGARDLDAINRTHERLLSLWDDEAAQDARLIANNAVVPVVIDAGRPLTARDLPLELLAMLVTGQAQQHYQGAYISKESTETWIQADLNHTSGALALTRSLAPEWRHPAQMLRDWYDQHAAPLTARASYKAYHPYSRDPAVLVALHRARTYVRPLLDEASPPAGFADWDEYLAYHAADEKRRDWYEACISRGLIPTVQGVEIEGVADLRTIVFRRPQRRITKGSPVGAPVEMPSVDLAHSPTFPEAGPAPKRAKGPVAFLGAAGWNWRSTAQSEPSAERVPAWRRGKSLVDGTWR